MSKILMFIILFMFVLLFMVINIFNKLSDFQQSNNLYMFKMGIEIGCLQSKRDLNCKQMSKEELNKLKDFIK